MAAYRTCAKNANFHSGFFMAGASRFQSALMSACLITARHLTISVWMKAAYSSGVLPTG